jgi:predicted ATPase/DNA-binding CsgD family transcriptional regulator
MVSVGQLIGRERELADLERSLGSERLLTVTGTGGCGKTRVALELTERVGSETGAPDCVVVELSSVGNAEHLIDALLRAVGARERSGLRPAQVLREALAPRELLLVLDNCEHLVTILGPLVGDLLEAAPGVRALATSRAPLGIAGERVFRLGPLSLPEVGDGVGAVVRSDAGRLFVDRAVAVDAEFALTPAAARAVARICHELDGLPLALCLAAARVDMLTASEIADGLAARGRLDGAPSRGDADRHRSVRASLDWSYALLEAPERVLLRRLSAFSGGFTTAAAHAVAAPDLDEVQVRGHLHALEAKGLITRPAGAEAERWAFLHTIREHAAEQLDSEGEQEEARERHLEFFRAFAADADELLLLATGHQLVDAEAPNLRSALAYAAERDVDSAMAIIAALMRHWVLAEHFEEGRAACATVLSLGAGGAPGVRAVVHCGAGLIGMLAEDYTGAIANIQAGLALLAAADDLDAEARCLLMSGIVLILTGLDLEGGRRHAHRASEIARACGDALGLAWALVNVAMVEAICDRFDAARTAYDEFLAIPNASEHARLRTWAELALAWSEVVAGSPERALAHADLADALEGDWPSMTHFQIAGFRIHALARLGRTDDALREGALARSGAQASGALQAIPSIDLPLVVAELVNGDLDAAEERGRRLLGVPQRHTLALVRETLGHIALARGDGREAEGQARELEAVSQQTGSARHRAVAQFIRGCAALLAGDLDRGRDLLQSALATDAELGLEREATDVLNALAWLAARTGDTARAARLAGAASAELVRLGCAPLRPMSDRLAATRAQAVARDGAATWDAAWVEGDGLSLADAIGYARRGRGRRDRPSEGWASLTPAELDVASLAASGLSNPQIASRLFVSRATVKMHLSNVYMKVRVANRTELAAAMAMHTADTERRFAR